MEISVQQSRPVQASALAVAAAALLTAGLTSIGAVALFRPSGAEIIPFFLRLTLYASVAALAFWFLLGRQLLRRLRFVGASASFVVGASTVLAAVVFGVLFAVAGLVVDRSPIAGIIGVPLGAWLGFVGAVCLTGLERSARVSVVLVIVVLVIDAAALPFAVAALV